MTISLPKGHLSVSQIRTYLTCHKKYEFQVIMGIRSPGGFSLLDGRTFHKVMEQAHRFTLENAETLPVDAVMQFYSEAWNIEKTEKPDDYDFTADLAKGETEKERKATGLAAIEAYFTEYGQHIIPRMIEMGTTFEIGGVLMKGYIDLVDHTGVIRDYKKSGASKQESVVHDSIQLVSYALAYREMTGEQETGIGLDYIIDLKKGPKIQRFEILEPVEDARIERFSNTVANVAKGISAGIFPRDEEGMGCSWCGYREMCKGRK